MIKKLTTIFLAFFSIILISGCNSPAHKNSLSPEEQADLIKKGKEIAAHSFKALSGELMKALQENDVQYAVSYCHLQASPLIDSLSIVYKAKINRVSDKYRNPSNKPGDLDLTVLESYLKQHKEGQNLQPHLEITSNEVVFYSPILVQNPVCLLCHGEPGETMEQENFDFINSTYPGDMATGYKLGDFRGLWKIVFNSNI